MRIGGSGSSMLSSWEGRLQGLENKDLAREWTKAELAKRKNLKAPALKGPVVVSDKPWGL